MIQANSETHMAKQKSIIKLEGTIGDISFYKSKDGYLARERGGITAERIATDPKFQRTRENGAEFGRAGKAGKLLRTALKQVIQNTADGRMTSRLAKEMVRVIKADLVSERGLRNVLDGELELLTGFDFNEQGKLSTTIFAPYSATIDRVSGLLSIEFPPFDPAIGILAVPNATHFRLKAAGAMIDFEKETYITASSTSDALPVKEPIGDPVQLSCQLEENSGQPLFLVLGIEFVQIVNGREYLLTNGAYNGLCLVKISGISNS